MNANELGLLYQGQPQSFLRGRDPAQSRHAVTVRRTIRLFFNGLLPRMRKSDGEQTMRYQIVLRAEAEGGYTVMVPALPGCITWGRTISQAKRMGRDAIGGYLVSLAKHGEPIPDDDDILTASVDVPIATEVIHG